MNTAQRELPPHLVATPRIVNTAIPQDDRSELGEMTVSAGPLTAPANRRAGYSQHYYVKSSNTAADLPG